MHIYNKKEYNFMGELMIKKYVGIKRIVLPSKKINMFILSVLILGVIMGSIYSTIIGLNDKNLVIDKIKLFIENINNNSLNTFLAFKNSMGINLMYVFLIWILGMSLLGIIFSIILLFLKGFIFGFSIASFILTYNFKGIILSFIYLLFGQLLNIIIIMILAIYSIMFTIKLLGLLFKKNNNSDVHIFFKNYVIILAIAIIFVLVSSFFESFILCSLIKLVIKLFI